MAQLCGHPAPDEAKFSMLHATTMVVGCNSIQHVAWYQNLTRINLVGTKLFDAVASNKLHATSNLVGAKMFNANKKKIQVPSKTKI